MATSGKIAVITGAGSGIGRATAQALLEAGWNVVLAGRRRDMLEETAALAGVMPPRTLAVPTDIRDPAQIAALFDAVKTTYGCIDLLFNNAGISTRGIPFEELTYEGRTGVQHRLRPDRYRQRRDDPQRGHRARPVAGFRPGRGRGPHRCERRRQGRPLHGRAAPRGQRAVHDRDGEQDALCRPGVNSA